MNPYACIQIISSIFQQQSRGEGVRWGTGAGQERKISNGRGVRKRGTEQNVPGHKISLSWAL